jgi:hypothetical protein
MLCDDIIADGAPGCGCDISCLLPTIKDAQKFTLGPEFAAAAEALSEDYTGLVRVFDRCRLPFGTMWIEVAQADRPAFMKAGIHAEQFQVRPKRVGYLLTSTRKDLSAWKAHLFWSTNLGCSAAALAMRFDMTQSMNNIDRLPTAEEYKQEKAKYRVVNPNTPPHPGWHHANATVKLAMLQHTDPIVPDYGIISLPDNVTEKQVEEFYDIVFELARADWAGEPAYLLAVIGLLNARNAVETQTVDYRKLNRARVKRGAAPLFEHKILKIAHRQMHRVYGDIGSCGNYAPMRAHMVRGHFKARRSGIFFWSPHVRGDFAHGRIEKEYATP